MSIVGSAEEAHSHRQEDSDLPVHKIEGESPPDGQDWISECEETLRDHTALCRATERALAELFSGDPLLHDIPADVSAEEVEAQVALLNGQAITVHVERERLPTLKVIIPSPETTVSDFKKAVRRTFELERHSSTKDTSAGSSGKSSAKISWRYIWRTYLLSHEKQPLIDDSQSLSHYGIVNKSSLNFVKRSKVRRMREKR